MHDEETLRQPRHPSISLCGGISVPKPSSSHVDQHIAVQFEDKGAGLYVSCLRILHTLRRHHPCRPAAHYVREH